MLTKALVERGHDVVLWTSTFEHVQRFHHFTESQVLRVDERTTVNLMSGRGYHHDHAPSRLLHNRETAREFLRMAAESNEPPDLVFAPVPTLELAESSASYAMAHRLPVVIDVRDRWPDVYLAMFPDWMESQARWILRSEFRRAHRIFSRATGITAVSPSFLRWGLAQAKRDMSASDQVFHIGFPDEGFDRESLDAQKRTFMTRYGLSRDDKVIAFAGTFSADRALDKVIEAARHILHRRPSNVWFFIIGDGDGNQRLRDSAKDLPHVVFTGWQDNLSLRALLEMSTVGLAPYTSDALMSLPNKPFEYMAAGLPILSSLKGELEELIHESRIGRQFVAEDPRSLIYEIEWCLSHGSETKQMSRRSRDLYERHFRSEAIYGRLAAFLEGIAASNGQDAESVSGN
jgi:glycosyltransferase involved in cell wall biosynthesis